VRRVLPEPEVNVGTGASLKPNRDFDHVFAIIRIDDFQPLETLLAEKVAVTKILWDEEAAKREVDRLNGLKKGKYLLQATRIDRQAAVAEKAAIAAARQRAERTRQEIGGTPPPSELLAPQELADAAPFYFVLREYIRQLKEAREAAGLTLADVAARTEMAVESLSQLESGALTNPTWKTLATYAKALGRRPRLVLETLQTKAPQGRAKPSPTKAAGKRAKPTTLTRQPERSPDEAGARDDGTPP